MCDFFVYKESNECDENDHWTLQQLSVCTNCTTGRVIGQCLKNSQLESYIFSLHKSISNLKTLKFHKRDVQYETQNKLFETYLKLLIQCSVTGSYMKMKRRSIILEPDDPLLKNCYHNLQAVLNKNLQFIKRDMYSIVVSTGELIRIIMNSLYYLEESQKCTHDIVNEVYFAIVDPVNIIES